MEQKKFNNIYMLSLLKKSNTILFGLIATIFLNRALGSTLRGEYAYIYNIISTLVVILHLGISSIFPNYYRKKREWTTSTFVAMFIMQFIFYMLTGVITSIVLKSNDVLIWSMAVAFGVLSNQMQNICIVTNYKASVIANIAGVILNAILLFIVFVFYPKNLDYAFMSLIIKEFIIIIISILAIRKDVSLKQVNFSECFGIIRTGIVIMLTNLLIILNYRVDVIMLKYLHIDYYDIGLYSVGISLAEYAWIIPDIFKEVIINKTASKDNLESVSFCIRMSSTASIIVYIVILFFSKGLIVLLFGLEYEQAYSVTNIIFLGIYSMIYCKLLGALFLAQGKWFFYFFVLLGSAIINIAVNIFLIPIMGINGAAVTSVVSYTFAGGWFLISYKKNYSLSYWDLLFIQKNDINKLLAYIKN